MTWNYPSNEGAIVYRALTWHPCQPCEPSCNPLLYISYISSRKCSISLLFYLIKNICRGGSATKVNNYSFFITVIKNFKEELPFIAAHEAAHGGECFIKPTNHNLKTCHHRRNRNSPQNRDAMPSWEVAVKPGHEAQRNGGHQRTVHIISRAVSFSQCFH